MSVRHRTTGIKDSPTGGVENACCCVARRLLLRWPMLAVALADATAGVFNNCRNLCGKEGGMRRETQSFFFKLPLVCE